MESFVGCHQVDLFDEVDDVTFPMAVFYPTSAPAATLRMEIFELEIATDAAPAEGAFPLVLISHGSGGSPLLYRTLALHLARNGFVVGLPKHPFNNWRDNSLEGQADNLANRPRHIQRAIDWFFDEKHTFALSDNFAIIGHSMGGCTALTMAGGVPTSKETTGEIRKIEVEHDSRLKALVLLAPATTWFGAEGALKKVDAPILMYIGDQDECTPYNPHARLVLDGLSDKTKVRCKIVEKAGHFSFLSPFPKRMVRESYPPSQDPPGFARPRFLDELNTEVLDFLSQTLARGVLADTIIFQISSSNAFSKVSKWGAPSRRDSSFKIGPIATKMPLLKARHASLSLAVSPKKSGA